MRFLACFCVMAAATAMAQPLETGEAPAKRVVRPAEGDTVADHAPPSDGKLEKRLSDLRNRQIAELRKLIHDNPHHPKKAELRFRLAEKLWAEADYDLCVKRGDCIQ